MVVKNVHGFPAVYNALMTFKALPKNILMALTGVSENEFQKMIRSQAIYKQTGDMYSLNPSVIPNKDLVNAASFFTNYQSTSNILLINRMPTTFVFTIRSTDSGISLCKLCLLSPQTAPIVSSLITPDISYLFCMFQNPDIVSKLPSSTDKCRVLYAKLQEYDESNLPRYTLTQCV